MPVPRRNGNQRPAPHLHTSLPDLGLSRFRAGISTASDRVGLFVFNHMSKTIFRVNRKSHFTTIPNTTVRDKTLSFRARGILALLLSNTEDWVVHKSWIVEQGTEGKEAIAAALRELESRGYATYAELREKGQFVGAQ
jgi:hypothetical protein